MARASKSSKEEKEENVLEKPILVKTINVPLKVVQFREEPGLCELIGASGSGKSFLLTKFLLNPDFYFGFNPTCIFYVYKYWQKSYMEALQTKYKNKITFISADSTANSLVDMFHEAPFMKDRDADSPLGLLFSV